MAASHLLVTVAVPTKGRASRRESFFEAGGWGQWKVVRKYSRADCHLNCQAGLNKDVSIYPFHYAFTYPPSKGFVCLKARSETIHFESRK